jgi:hypothetical protein
MDDIGLPFEVMSHRTIKPEIANVDCPLSQRDGAFARKQSRQTPFLITADGAWLLFFFGYPELFRSRFISGTVVKMRLPKHSVAVAVFVHGSEEFLFFRELPCGHLFRLFFHVASSLSSAYAALVVLILADSSEPHRQSRSVPLVASTSCGQPFVSQALSADRSNHAIQPFGCVILYVALIQPPCKLIGVAANMLGADVMEGSVHSTLEHSPNAFNAVSGSDSPRVFASGVVDGFMLEKQPVKIRENNAVIRVKLSPNFDVVMNVGCDGLHSAFIHRGKHGASVTFTHTKHGSFADSTTASFQLFVLMLVPFLATDETLIKFNYALQLCELRASASLTYPMKNKPRGLLRNTDFLRQLQRTDALTGSYQQVHGIKPLVKRDMGTLKDRSGSDGEVDLTGIAAIEAALSGSDSLASLASRTDSAIGPKSRFQIDPCGFRIGKHLEQLERANCGLTHSFSSLFARCTLSTATGCICCTSSSACSATIREEKRLARDSFKVISA